MFLRFPLALANDTTAHELKMTPNDHNDNEHADDHAHDADHDDDHDAPDADDHEK